MREREIENYLTYKVKRNGGASYKWSSPARRGVPDRLVFFSGGRLYAVEVKAPGKKPTRLQQYEHTKLRTLGVDVRVIDTKDAVDIFISEIIGAQDETTQ